MKNVTKKGNFAIENPQKFQLSIIFIFSFLLSSFALVNIKLDLPKTLGMTQFQIDEKITKSLLGGYLNSVGITTLKSILVGNNICYGFFDSLSKKWY